MRTTQWAKFGIPIGLALVVPASATFHLVKVVELFPGTAVSPNAQYVNLQMFASGQEFVGGHALTLFDRTGALVGSVTFPGNLGNGANQAKILIATTQAQTFFGVNADLVMARPAVLAAGGKACWAGSIDWVAFSSRKRPVPRCKKTRSRRSPSMVSASRLRPTSVKLF